MKEMKDKKILCIIPARGGSQRVPRKNVKDIGGNPLISYSIKSAIDSGVFAKVVLSSDDDEILEVAKKYGADIDIRPNELASNHAKAVEVIYEYISRDGVSKEFDIVALMLPTCPFRTEKDVKKAVNSFIENIDNFDYLVAVTPYDFPPQLAMQVNDDSSIKLREEEQYNKTTRTQSIGKLYHPNGAIYLAKIPAYLKTKTFFKEPMMAFEMPNIRSFDIDEPYQMKIADYIMTEKIHLEE